MKQFAWQEVQIIGVAKQVEGGKSSGVQTGLLASSVNVKVYFYGMNVIQ